MNHEHDEFRDAIGRTEALALETYLDSVFSDTNGYRERIKDGGDRGCSDPLAFAVFGDAVLAMPEMQAIRALLLNMVENNAVGWWDFGGREAGRNYLRRRGAPESVITWALAE